jgi:HEAT repeat protein
MLGFTTTPCWLARASWVAIAAAHLTAQSLAEPEVAITTPDEAVANPKVLALIDQFNSPHDARWTTAMKLRDFGPAAIVAVPALIDGFEDPNHRVRWQSIRALAEIAPDDARVIELILHATNDSHSQVQCGAIRLIDQLQLHGEAVFAHLVEAASDADKDVRRSATMALSRFGSNAVAPLIALLQYDHDGVQSQAATSIGRLGIHARGAIPALLDAAHQRHYNVRMSAVAAMGNLLSEFPELIGPLREALSDPESAVRMSAIEGLGKAQPDSIVAFKALKEVITTGNRIDQYVASKWLPRFGSAGVELVCQHLDSDGVRYEADEWIGQRTTDSVPALVTALKQGAGESRLAAADVLGDLGPVAKSSIQALAQATAEQDLPVQARAIWALGALGPNATSELIAILQKSPHLQPWVVLALQRGGPESGAALLEARRTMVAFDWSLLGDLPDELVKQDDVAWSAWTTSDGLAMRCRVPPGPFRQGDSLRASFELMNIAETELIMVDPEWRRDISIRPSFQTADRQPVEMNQWMTATYKRGVPFPTITLRVGERRTIERTFPFEEPIPSSYWREAHRSHALVITSGWWKFFFVSGTYRVRFDYSAVKLDVTESETQRPWQGHVWSVRLPFGVTDNLGMN